MMTTMMEKIELEAVNGASKSKYINGLIFTLAGWLLLILKRIRPDNPMTMTQQDAVTYAQHIVVLLTPIWPTY